MEPDVELAGALTLPLVLPLDCESAQSSSVCRRVLHCSNVITSVSPPESVVAGL